MTVLDNTDALCFGVNSLTPLFLRCFGLGTANMSLSVLLVAVLPQCVEHTDLPETYTLNTNTTFQA